MRRSAIGLSVLSLVLVACQDTQQPTASFETSDGSEFGGDQNQYFYFLPPLVPSPDFSGEFEGRLLPYLSVQVSLGAVCKADPDFTFDDDNGLTVDLVAERYSYDWNTPKSLKRDQVYRVCVVLDVPGVVDTVLGFRDVSPTQGGGSVAEAPVYLFNTGSNLAIKFRVEEGVLSPALCTGATGPLDYDCTAQFLTSNETATCENGTCALTTGIIEGDSTELFLIEKFGTANPACWESPGYGNPVEGFPLTIDIPQYAGCLRVTLFDSDNSFEGFFGGSRGLLEACFYEETGPALLPEQDEAVQLHVQYSTSPNVVWALPWSEASEGVVINCDDVALYDTSGGRLLAAARRFWRKTQEVVNPWFAPPKLYAFHTGFGGHSSFSPDEGAGVDGFMVAASPTGQETGAVSMTSLSTTASTCEQDCPPKVFHLTWALPSQMSGTICDDGGNCSDDGTLTVPQGAQVTIEVAVTDNGAVDDTALGRKAVPHPTADEGLRPVNGAKVYFDNAVTPLVTGPDGKVSLPPFQANTSRTVTARGFGIGLTDGGGPFDAFDASGRYTDLPTLLAGPPLTFNVRVCPAAPNVDGNITADDGYPTESGPATITDNSAWRTIPVNLGGSTSGTGYLYVTNDCDYLYVAFLMPSDNSKDNRLRFVFSETGSEALNDDIWSLSAAGPRDRYLSQDCIGSKQADCGPDDPDQILTEEEGKGVAMYQDFSDGTFLGRSAWYVYEMKRKLNTTSPYDFTLVFGDAGQSTIHFYGAVSLGTGTKGNTEFPDQKGAFKSYGYTYILQQ